METPSPLPGKGIVQALLIGLFALGTYVTLGSGLKGPEFLTYYVFLLGGLLFSKTLLEEQIARLVPFVLFEAVGILRFVEGSLHGMHRFGYMFLLMVVGGFLFFLSASSFSESRGTARADGSSSGSSWSFFSSSCSSSSSSSGCSSGSSGCSSGGGGCGGGGGGCGGCGGS